MTTEQTNKEPFNPRRPEYEALRMELEELKMKAMYVLKRKQELEKENEQLEAKVKELEKALAWLVNTGFVLETLAGNYIVDNPTHGYVVAQGSTPLEAIQNAMLTPNK